MSRRHKARSTSGAMAVGRPLVVVVLLAASVAACSAPDAGGPPDTPSATDQPTRAIIVDTDMDSSDVMALPYLLTLPGVEVLAVTVTGTGVAHCPPGAANAGAVARAVGVDVPTACGPDRPIGAGQPFPDQWRSPADDLYGLDLPPAPANRPAGGAVELLTAVVADSDEPVDLLTLGPLTNAAGLLQTAPELVPRIGRIIIMGGAIDAPGNVATDAAIGAPEWNIWADPEAARVVFEADVPITLVPLDATDDVPIEPGFLEELGADHTAVGADLTYELLRRNRFLVEGGQFFWDQLASVIVEEPRAVTIEEMPLTIGTSGPDTGRTMRDDAGRRVDVALSADADLFMDTFLRGLRRGPPATSPFAVEASLAVTWDGTQCILEGPDAFTSGAIEVTFADVTGSGGLALLELDPEANWQMVGDYLEAYRPGVAEPAFATVLPLSGSTQVVDLHAGTAGFACVSIVDNEVASGRASASVTVTDE